MNPERYRQVMRVVDAVMDCGPEGPEAALAAACAGDDALRREAERLLAHHTAAGDFLGDSPLDVIQELDPPPVGQRIGPYRVTGELGRGGMGAVYLAVRDDEQYKTEVAIKLIKRGMDSEAILRRFRMERQILANLNHPNIARLLDGGTTEKGLPFFVMEFIEGLPITEYADAHRLTTAERLELFRAACAAVTYAHTNLIVHRDLKPTNILVTPGGVPKLLDFGIAKILRTDFSSQATELTATELRVMTPEYASPEQVRGQSITTASDVYSLGVLLYELLTGRRPYHFDSRRPDEVARVICEQEPARPSTVVGRFVETTPGGQDSTPERLSLVRDGSPEKLQRRLRGDLDKIVLMALRKEPARRYSSVEQLAEDIRRYLEGLPVRAHKDTLAYRGAKFVRRNKAGVVAAALVFAVLLAGIIVTITQRNRAEQQRARAEKEEFRNRQLLYAAQMNLAYQAWETNNVGRALDLLEAQKPAPGSEDFRGFEWHLLWRLTHERSQVLRGPTEQVGSVSFSPDASKLLVGSWDGTVRFWDAKTGQSVSSWEMNSCPAVIDVDITPDGKYLAGACKDGPGRLWNAENGQLIRTLEGHSGEIGRLEISPDGRLLATAGADHTVKLWSMDSAGEEVATLRGHTKHVTSVAFSPDGKMLASSSADSTVKLWDVESRKEMATFRGHTWDVWDVAFSPDGKTLATTGSDSDIRLWDLSTRREIGTIEGDDITANTLSFSPDGKRIAVGGGSTVVKIYDVATRKLSDLLRGHTDHILSLAFSPDGKTLTSGSVDMTVRLWDLTKQPGALTLDAHTDWAWSLAFSPDGRTLATSSKDATVKLWEVPGGRELKTLRHPKWVNGVAFSPDGAKLATASDDKLVRLWDAVSGEIISSTSEHNGVAECVTFSPDGKLMASGSSKQEIKLWDTSTGSEVATLRPQNSPYIWSLAFSPDGRFLASGEGGRRDGFPTGTEVTLWDVSSRQILETLKEHKYDVRAVAFSPNGSILASGSEEGTIKIWDVRTRQEIITLKSGKIASLAFSPDGKRLVSGGIDKMVKLWDVTTWQELCTLNLPSEITSVGFSPDGHVLAVATKDNKVRLWSTATED